MKLVQKEVYISSGIGILFNIISIIILLSKKINAIGSMILVAIIALIIYILNTKKITRWKKGVYNLNNISLILSLCSVFLTLIFIYSLVFNNLSCLIIESIFFIIYFIYNLFLIIHIIKVSCKQ